MPGFARMTDICMGHGCFPSKISCSASPNIFVNSIPGVRAGDIMCGHCCGPSCHIGIHCGYHNVGGNCMPVQTCMDPISCGSIQAQCSSNVYVN